MSAYTGKDVFVRFRGITLTSDQRSLDINEQQGVAETSAGPATDRSYVPTLADGTMSMSFVDQGVDGADMRQALARGNSGTLEMGPEGTAAGKPKFVCLAIVTANNKSHPYDDTVTFDITFQKNGEWIESYDLNGDTW